MLVAWSHLSGEVSQSRMELGQRKTQETYHPRAKQPQWKPQNRMWKMTLDVVSCFLSSSLRVRSPDMMGGTERGWSARREASVGLRLAGARWREGRSIQWEGGRLLVQVVENGYDMLMLIVITKDSNKENRLIQQK